jgi:hypothetical protein
MENWQNRASHSIYKIVKLLPPEEKYSLTSQMMREVLFRAQRILQRVMAVFIIRKNNSSVESVEDPLYEAQDNLITCLDNNYITK